MSSTAKDDQELIRKQIQILSSCKQGLLSSLILEINSPEHKKPEPLFWIDNDLRMIIPNSNDGHIRMSYLALLKICFEKNSALSSSILNNFKRQICRQDICLDLYPVQLIGPKYSKYYYNHVLKKIILEFFILLRQSNRSILEYVTKYPILDVVMITTLKTMLWHRKPTRLIQAQGFPIDSLIAYFRETLGIRLSSSHQGQIVFEDFRMYIGFENLCLYLHDQDARKMVYAEESRVTPYQQSFKDSALKSCNTESSPPPAWKAPQGNSVQKVLTNSWVIPEQSIYERLESQDCMFTEETPQQSRQRQGVKQLIRSFKRTLIRGTESLNASKQNRGAQSGKSQRLNYSQQRVLSDKSGEIRAKSNSWKQNYLSNGESGVVRLAESFEEVVVGGSTPSSSVVRVQMVNS